MLFRSKRREQLASEAALSRQLPAKAIEDSIKSALIREGQARAGQAARSEEGPVAKQMAIQRELAAAEKRAASVAVGGGAADVAKILDEQIKGLIDRGAPKRDIAELQSVLEEVRNKIRVASDESVRTVFQLAGKTTDAIEAATLSIERAGVPQSILGKDVNSIAEKRNEIVNKLEKTTDPAETEALKRQQAALLSQATALLSAARSAEQFAAALDRVAGDLAKIGRAHV